MSIESKRKPSQSRLESVASQQNPALSMGDIDAATFGDANSQDHEMLAEKPADDQVDLGSKVQPTFGE